MSSSPTSNPSPKPSRRSTSRRSRTVTPEVGAEIATTALLSREQFIGQIWDAYHRDHGIMTALSKAGLSCFCTSLSFHEYATDMANVVTEPPPDEGEVYLRRALEVVTNKVALLLPVSFLSMVASKRLFDQTGLTRVYMLAKKPVHRKSPMAWFVWEKGNFAAPGLRFL